MPSKTRASKLSDTDITLIKYLYQNGHYGVHKLCKEYKISQNRVYNILNGKELAGGWKPRQTIDLESILSEQQPNRQQEDEDEDEDEEDEEVDTKIDVLNTKIDDVKNTVQEQIEELKDEIDEYNTHSREIIVSTLIDAITDIINIHTEKLCHINKLQKITIES